MANFQAKQACYSRSSHNGEYQLKIMEFYFIIADRIEADFLFWDWGECALWHFPYPASKKQKSANLCAAWIRAMSENEIPRVLRGDIYYELS